MQVVEGREQLAVREVAGPAENHDGCRFRHRAMIRWQECRSCCLAEHEGPLKLLCCLDGVTAKLQSRDHVQAHLPETDESELHASSAATW